MSLPSSMAVFVPCDRLLQKGYYLKKKVPFVLTTLLLVKVGERQTMMFPKGYSCGNSLFAKRGNIKNYVCI